MHLCPLPAEEYCPWINEYLPSGFRSYVVPRENSIIIASYTMIVAKPTLLDTYGTYNRGYR